MIDCTNARPLIPSYLDGELSEAQAGPLRKHLLDCQPCRGAAQGEKNLKRWFVEEAPIAIPKDFSARVARRAFAGDTGERSHERILAGGPRALVRDDEHLRFLLWATAVAAGMLVALSIALGQLRLPASGRLMADPTPETKLERVLDDLDRLNREEGRTAARPEAATPVAGDAAGAPAGDRRQ